MYDILDKNYFFANDKVGGLDYVWCGAFWQSTKLGSRRSYIISPYNKKTNGKVERELQNNQIHFFKLLNHKFQNFEPKLKPGPH